MVKKKDEKKDREEKLEERKEKIESAIGDLETEYLGEVMKEQGDFEKEVELKRGYRILEHDKKKYHIYSPSLSIDNEALGLRAKKLREFMLEYPPLRKLREELETNEIWTKKDEKKIDEIRNEIREIRIELEDRRNRYRKIFLQLETEANRLQKEKNRISDLKTKSKKDKNRLKEIEKKQKKNTEKMSEYGSELIDISYNLSEKYTDFVTLSAEKLSYESGSLENQVNNWVLYHKVTKCAFEINGKKEKLVWNSVDDLMEDKNTQFVQKIITQSQDFWRGGESSFFEDLQGVLGGELTGE